jgi:two-component system response regulator AtoC
MTRPSIGATLIPRRLELVVHLGRDVRAYPLPDQGVLTIGRAPECDIRIDHRSVSRFHLLLHLEAQLQVEDRGSANGTVVHGDPDAVSGTDELTGGRQQGQRLPANVKTPVELGTMIQIGSVLLAVQQRRASNANLVRARGDSDKLGPAVLLDPAMKELYSLAARAARGDMTVLVLGETGSGKEILAETIHYRSRRSAGPFLRLNCAAFGESLLESELFGYERGAFTGAQQARTGLLESSNGGSVFLDEIGELPLSIQAKLLRVLEERTVRPVGSNKTRTVDVRFITATNRDLRREIKRGTFREDLYFRVSGIRFEIPPLRKRPSEILPLAEFFLARYCTACGLPTPRIADDAKQRLLDYPWPGNVRELRSSMERAVFLSPDGNLHADHLLVDNALDKDWLPQSEEDGDSTGIFEPPTDVRLPPFIPPRIEDIPVSADPLPPASMPEDERERVQWALERCAGNQTRAAALLGISRRTLINRLDAFGIQRPRKLL